MVWHGVCMIIFSANNKSGRFPRPTQHTPYPIPLTHPRRPATGNSRWPPLFSSSPLVPGGATGISPRSTFPQVHDGLEHLGVGVGFHLHALERRLGAGADPGAD